MVMVFIKLLCFSLDKRGEVRGHGHDHMVVIFTITTTNAICAHHKKSCKFESCLWVGILDTTLCDKVC